MRPLIFALLLVFFGGCAPAYYAAFWGMSDAEVWKAVLRSCSSGALRVVVEEDRLDFQAR